MTDRPAERHQEHSGEHERTLVLASASPRRRELLGYLGLRFDVVATAGEEEQTAVPEEVLAALPFFPLAQRTHPTLLAWRKIHAARAEGWRGVLLGADTIVVIDGQVLNKPRDPGDARRMLGLLAGRTHTVYTGVATLDTNRPENLRLALARSDVTMATLSAAEIAAYVATGEPLDKAGAYGIQGLGGRLVERVEGSYTAVVGLPLVTVYHDLQALGLQPGTQPADAFRQWLADMQKEVPPCTVP